MAGIGVFLYTVLKPYRLETLGILLSSFSISMMVGQFIYQIFKMVRAPRPKPLSRPRMAATAIILGLVAAGVASIPVPVYIQAAVLIQPHDVQHVYNRTGGSIDQINVQPGDFVQEEQTLAVLNNPQLDDQVLDLERQIAVQEQRRQSAMVQQDSAQQQLANNSLNSLRAQLAEKQEQHGHLTLRAPVSGSIVSAESQPQQKRPSDDHRLDQWHGDPLKMHNLGALLQPNTHLCSIAPDDRLEAVLFIDQADRNDLHEGLDIRIKFDHLPEQIYEGKVEDLATQAVAFVPAVVSNKTGGPLPTVTEGDNRERLTSVAWKARVVLDRDTEMFVSGLRGRARVVIDTRSLGSWCYRWFRNTIHFRM